MNTIPSVQSELIETHKNVNVFAFKPQFLPEMRQIVGLVVDAEFNQSVEILQALEQIDVSFSEADLKAIREHYTSVMSQPWSLEIDELPIQIDHDRVFTGLAQITLIFNPTSRAFWESNDKPEVARNIKTRVCAHAIFVHFDVCDADGNMFYCKLNVLHMVMAGQAPVQLKVGSFQRVCFSYVDKETADLLQNPCVNSLESRLKVIESDYLKEYSPIRHILKNVTVSFASEVLALLKRLSVGIGVQNEQNSPYRFTSEFRNLATAQVAVTFDEASKAGYLESENDPTSWAKPYNIVVALDADVIKVQFEISNIDGGVHHCELQINLASDLKFSEDQS